MGRWTLQIFQIESGYSVYCWTLTHCYSSMVVKGNYCGTWQEAGEKAEKAVIWLNTNNPNGEAMEFPSELN